MPFDETATTRGYLISEVGVTLHNRKPQQNSNSNCKQGADHRAMAEGRHRQEEHEEEDYVIAFKSGNKLVAEQLLPRIPQPVAITTTFEFSSYFPVVALVSLVHLAAYWGWRNVVTALVSVYKCAANCKDEKGHIPLHYAAYNGHLEVVKYFVIELLCDPMDRNNMAGTPLHLLVIMVTSTSSERNTQHCENQYTSSMERYLIREHCNPSCENKDGVTPLHNACTNGHLNIAQYLIREEHCNPSCENNNGDTPLHFACEHGNLNIAQYLIREEHCNPSCKGNGSTPLHYACSNGHLNIAQYLIREEHCNPSCENNTWRYTTSRSLWSVAPALFLH